MHVHERFATHEYLMTVWRMMLLFARTRLPKALTEAAARSRPYRWWRQTRHRAADGANRLERLEAVGSLQIHGG